jgi:hypothetical protein
LHSVVQVHVAVAVNVVDADHDYVNVEQSAA